MGLSPTAATTAQTVGEGWSLGAILRGNLLVSSFQRLLFFEIGLDGGLRGLGLNLLGI